MALVLRQRPFFMHLNDSPALSKIFLLSLSIAGCTTEKTAPPPTPDLPAKSSKQSQQPSQQTQQPSQQTQQPSQQSQPEQNQQAAKSRRSIPVVTQFESALAKRDCPTIQSLEGELIATPESYSNSVILATSWCAQQKSPQEKELLNKFLASADLALKIETPLFSGAFLEQLKGEALAAAGDLNGARTSFSRAMSISALHFMSLVSGQTLKLELQNLEPSLTGTQSALLKDVRASLADPATQASTLTKLDELLAQVSPGPTYDKLRTARLKLFAAFELAFASQLSALEDVRLKGDATSLEEISNKIRRLFPSRAHQMRVDAITGTSNTGKSPVTEILGASQSNLCPSTLPSDTPIPNEKSELSAEKAIQLSKIALNEGKANDALEILDSLSETNKTEKTRALRRDALEAHVKEQRRRASDLYKKVTMTIDPQVKLDGLNQCKQLLDNILSRYPETDAFTKKSIQKFLNSISENIAELRKGRVK